VADPEYHKPTSLGYSATITDKAIDYKLLPDIHEDAWYIESFSWPMRSHPAEFGNEVTKNIVLMFARSRPIESFVSALYGTSAST
jgi:hypothetical protein